MSTSGYLLAIGAYEKTIPDKYLDYDYEYTVGAKIIVRLFYTWTKDGLDNLCNLFDRKRWSLTNHYISNSESQTIDLENYNWYEPGFGNLELDREAFKCLVDHGFDFVIVTDM